MLLILLFVGPLARLASGSGDFLRGEKPAFLAALGAQRFDVAALSEPALEMRCPRCDSAICAGLTDRAVLKTVILGLRLRLLMAGALGAEDSVQVQNIGNTIGSIHR